jgi:hypothetical protein
MEMADNSNRLVFDRVTDLLDAVTREPDPVQRLASLHFAFEMGSDRIYNDREKAAFDARLVLSLDALHEATGISRERIRLWSNTYRRRTGDERLYKIARVYRIKRRDWSDAIELTPPLLP